MNQENAYSKGYKEKYLLKSKTIVDLVGSIVKILYMCVFDKINHHHPQKEKTQSMWRVHIIKHIIPQSVAKVL